MHQSINKPLYNKQNSLNYCARDWFQIAWMTNELVSSSTSWHVNTGDKNWWRWADDMEKWRPNTFFPPSENEAIWCRGAASDGARETVPNGDLYRRLMTKGVHHPSGHLPIGDAQHRSSVIRNRERERTGEKWKANWLAICRIPMVPNVVISFNRTTRRPDWDFFFSIPVPCWETFRLINQSMTFTR